MFRGKYEPYAEPALATIRGLLCAGEEGDSMKRVGVVAVAIASQMSHLHEHRRLSQALTSPPPTQQPTPHRHQQPAQRQPSRAPARPTPRAATTPARPAEPVPSTSTISGGAGDIDDSLVLRRAIDQAAATWHLTRDEEALLQDGSVYVDKSKWQFLFQDVHTLCVGPHAPSLYLDVAATFAAKATVIRTELARSAEDGFLLRYREAFSKYRDAITYIDMACKFINDNLLHQDRAKKQTRLSSWNRVHDLGMKMWRERVYSPLKDILLTDAFKEVANARKGLSTSEHTLAGVLQSMLDMCSDLDQPATVYTCDFEQPFLATTRQQFMEESRAFLQDHGARDYLKWASAQLDSELLRSRVVLRPLSQPKLLDTCADALVRDHLDTFTTHAKAMLEEEQEEDLGRLYDLLTRTGDVQMLTSEYTQHVTATGTARMDQLKQARNLTAPTYFDAMCSLHTKFITMARDVFRGDPLFLAALDRACTLVANFDTAKAPEYLAKVCDQTLKRSSKSAITEEDMDTRLKQIITIFSFLQDKDVFQKFYSRHLARRLIQQTSVSEEAEQDMIGQLKAMCGFEFTSKLQRMFTDVTISGHLETEFKSAAASSDEPLPTNMHVLVLQTGAWPLSSSSDVVLRLPPALASCAQRFEQFYQAKHTGRKLTWLYSYSTAEMKARLAKVYDFTTTAYQMAVLLHFNHATEATVGTLQEQTQLADTTLARTLSSLVAAHVLKPQQEGQSLAQPDAADVFKLNTRYNNKRTRVRISAAFQKETAAVDRQHTRKAVDADRHLFLKATGVRVMKMRKTLHYNDLVQEIIEMSKSRFKPPIPAIKKCIEEMIDEQYIRREDGNRAMLSYIA
ncbi:hypothetical protein PTSG_08035 [Salpingoeca rosetta]|uniref:Cullin-5 n=1 Tax=Salpingoeca rosetta (strain ATCC 50818 / BSB-021) TaxID=946362 RepID=F2UHT5_SALR5|nr:uncharacterized protein PTSG_08035 [Salpingoeca rosetta]EGD76684.1 hypothetical protein PTSG_08035 [Salpingoeca rosetta]|eukprot:XP_004991056.1 hypothetical protein PTSG_08035 [Salpingoeca rosetta]